MCQWTVADVVRQTLARARDTTTYVILSVQVDRAAPAVQADTDSRLAGGVGAGAGLDSLGLAGHDLGCRGGHGDGGQESDDGGLHG